MLPLTPSRALYTPAWGVILGLAALALATSVPRQVLGAPTAPAADADSRYRSGRELYERGEWNRALDEFLASRQIRASWKATSGAALSLKQLKRDDESLEMFEALLREFAGELPTDAKEAAQRQMDELRRQVGVLD